jgi:PilZ domain
MMIERRRHRRFDLKLPFKVILARMNREPTGETRNLSSSGVSFTSEVPLEIGEPIEYLIKFPTAPSSQMEVHLHCSGKVIRNEAESTFAATLEHHEFLRKPGPRRTRI